MFSTIIQWIHVGAAAIGVGAIGFLVGVLLPSGQVLDSGQRDLLLREVMGRFRWVSWSVIALLLVSGIYNVGQVWEMPWGTYWRMLTIKIALAMMVFAISLCLTLPFKFLGGFRARCKAWLYVNLTLAMIVILISAYLRRG